MGIQEKQLLLLLLSNNNVTFDPEGRMEIKSYLQYFYSVCYEGEKTEERKIENVNRYLKDFTLNLYIKAV